VPYIRRDGERNPEIRVDYDAPRLAAMINAVTTLSLAYYFSDDEEYAGRARLLLRTWFLDPATRMNPHLRYGQGIPGITQGRAAGIIETRGLVGVVDAIGMLERSPGWTAADERGMAQWLSAYLGLLRSCDSGQQERRAHNNPRRKCPGHQITPTEPDLLVSALEQARLAYHDARYDALLRQIPEDAIGAHRALLLYPEPVSLAAASHAGS